MLHAHLLECVCKQGDDAVRECLGECRIDDVFAAAACHNRNCVWPLASNGFDYRVDEIETAQLLSRFSLNGKISRNDSRVIVI